MALNVVVIDCNLHLQGIAVVVVVGVVIVVVKQLTIFECFGIPSFIEAFKFVAFFLKFVESFLSTSPLM